jgi:hypothetical protein
MFISDLDPDFFTYPGVKKAPDPGSISATMNISNHLLSKMPLFSLDKTYLTLEGKADELWLFTLLAASWDFCMSSAFSAAALGFRFR